MPSKQGDIFGPWGRFKVHEEINRFGDLVYIVDDAERIDGETGLLDVVAIETSREKAIHVALQGAKQYKQTRIQNEKAREA